MKRTFCVILAALSVLMLTACGAKNDRVPEVQLPATIVTQTTDAPATQPNESSTTEQTGSGAKSLVVYFSRSGNTRNVAQSIQKQTGSDMFEIIPETPYDADYNTLLDVAKTEQQQSVRPEIAKEIENLEDYDTIYVGYPIWWGDMPMILYTFFDTYDLSGKTVALFCTSGGSGLSNTVNEVKTLEPEAMVTEGLQIGSSGASAPDGAVESWLEKIG